VATEMNQNTYHVIASHSKLVCDNKSQQERSMDEQEVTVRIYSKDLFIIEKFMEKHGIKKNADGIRVAIEYANAHGALK
jgi:hypothetical protein